jgi:hypothetical protein
MKPDFNGGRIMRFFCHRLVAFLAIVTVYPVLPEARAWHDKTHISIAEAAGFDLWYSAAAPDVAKSKKMFNPVEGPNHYFNNSQERRVTQELVMDQVCRYNDPEDREGHLYGAIISSVREYREAKAQNKYAKYPLVFCAHYCGDLSMPLHNTAYDQFNMDHHAVNDGMIESTVRSNIDHIRRMIRPPVIHNETDLAREIASIAETARTLGNRMRKENRDMTTDEAYSQIVRSASLFNAILTWLGQSGQAVGDCMAVNE